MVHVIEIKLLGTIPAVCQAGILHGINVASSAPAHHQQFWRNRKRTHSALIKYHVTCPLITAGGDELLPTHYQQQQVKVSTQHIGTYAFKGCGTLDMVAISIDDLAVQAVQQYKPGQQQQQQNNAASARNGKGMLIAPRSGPVVGQQHCPVVLPDVLPGLRRAWAAVQAVRHGIATQEVFDNNTGCNEKAGMLGIQQYTA